MFHGTDTPVGCLNLGFRNFPLLDHAPDHFFQGAFPESFENARETGKRAVGTPGQRKLQKRAECQRIHGSKNTAEEPL
jgi:hypothetical protein